jgi:hypothetical protein
MEKSNSEELSYVTETPLSEILPLIPVEVKNISKEEAKKSCRR